MKKYVLAFLVAASLFACKSGDEKKSSPFTAAGESREERNKKVVKAYMDGLLDLKVDEVVKNIDPEFVDYGDGSADPMKSRDSAAKYYGIWFDALGKLDAEDVEYIAEGDHVWVSATYSGKYKEDLGGMPVKGKTWEKNDVDMFVLNEAGKIIEHRSTQSNEVVLRQLGLQQGE